MSNVRNIIKVAPVILCGGSGTRLWPLSRAGFPKQFLALTGKESLFQQAAKRLSKLGNSDIQASNALIVTGEDHRFLAYEQLREVDIQVKGAVLEPEGRNTAPALTLAAIASQANGEDPVLVVTPADLSITNTEAFIHAAHKAIREAEKGSIVIFGIKPESPETGFGYIQAKSQLDGDNLAVEKFVEKPNYETALKYLEDGRYYWNAGIFVIKASVWLKALNFFREDIAKAVENAWKHKKEDKNFIRPGKEEYSLIPSESIDFAVMEHCPHSAFTVKMIPLNAGWSDLGTWDAVWRALSKDDQGNAHHGDVYLKGSSNTLVNAASRLVCLVGVKDICVLETPDAVLIVDRNQSQEVKRIVTTLQASNRQEDKTHRKVYRPWGWYDSIEEGENYKVKHIVVNSGESISLQVHNHRAEHWIVVKGVAEVTKGNEIFKLIKNESTYIPLGTVHRLRNPGDKLLEIIEIQTGTYLNEDDILRIEDIYGRDKD